jgi:RecA-family ATPase
MSATRINGIAVNGAPIAAERYTPRRELLLSAWLKRDLPPRDYLLGHVFCTTSRLIIYGDTGVGKTLFAADMGGAMASGCRFLDWESRRPARVMYLDGEMPAETFKERMELVAAQFGGDIRSSATAATPYHTAKCRRSIRPRARNGCCGRSTW